MSMIDWVRKVARWKEIKRMQNTDAPFPIIHEASFGDTVAIEDVTGPTPKPDEERKLAGLLEDADAALKPKPTTQCHLMLDLETFGTHAGAIIISIGAVKFWPNEPGGPILGELFHAAIDPRTCGQLGLQLDMGTLLWWLEPSQRGALDHWLSQKDQWQDIVNALEGFHQWVGEDAGPTWARGPSFDCVILRAAFMRVGRETPWHFRDDRDQRSIVGLMPSDWKPDVAPTQWHDALSDALRQTNILLQVVKAKGLVLS